MNEKEFKEYLIELRTQWKVELAKLNKNQGWLARQINYSHSYYSQKLSDMSFDLKKINEINELFNLPQIEVKYVFLPKFNQSNLKRIIKKAEPNLSKIKDVDTHLDNIK